jgi:serine protease Do
MGRFGRLAAIAVLLGGGWMGGQLWARGGHATADAATAAPAPVAPLPAPAQLSQAFEQAARVIKPSVVNVNTETVMKRTAAHGLFGEMPFGIPAPSERRGRGLGSGIIVDRSGYILTNNHVVEDAESVQVQLPGDTEPHPAKVVGTDPETDLAVLKIDAGKDLPAARLGNSDALNVGDWVLAVGSPFGLEQTVTAGIISATGRDVAASPFQRFLQTDAAINRGNSGGPLVTPSGEVIGINTLILSQGGSFEGVGFALPSNTASRVYQQIRDHGRVARGSIGVDFMTGQNPALLRSFGAKEGVVVNEVVPNGPADRAGLRSGDVITAVQGTPIKTAQDLVETVANTPIGTHARVAYMRDGKAQEATVAIGDRAEVLGDTKASREEGGDAHPTGQALGLRVSDSRDPAGVLVQEVESGGFAEGIGVQSGDVIVEAQHQPVHSVDDLRRIQRGLKSGQDVMLKVVRSGSRNGRSETRFLAGTLK